MTTSAYPLFGEMDSYKPKSHTSDPATSHEAARKHAESGKFARNKAVVLEMVRARPNCTATELWDGASRNDQYILGEMQEVRRRITDLSQEGKIVCGPARACRIKGSSMLVWSVAK